MVILLLGILSTFIASQYIDFTVDAKKNVTMARMNELRIAIVGDPRAVAGGNYISRGFLNQVGSLPSTLNDLVVQGAYASYDPFLQKGWSGPYVSTADPNWKLDAWGTALQYDPIGRTITSCGPDTICGNADDLAINF